MSKKTFQFSKITDEKSDDAFDSVSRFKKYKETKTGEPLSEDAVSSKINTNTQQQESLTNSKPSSSAVNHNLQASSSKSSASGKVGRSFAETFSFLKQTDIFELPPQPQPAEKFIPKSSNSIIVNTRQRGNPILKHVKNVPWEFGEIVPDYEVGQTSCVLFLSLRYHNLNPEYIHERLNLLGNRYNLRVILVQVDVINTKHSLKEIGKICILADCTLIVAWSSEEAGRYLETYKQYEHKPPDVLQERIDSDYLSRMQDVLTTIKSINKTDVITLLSNFGSLKNIVNASIEEISLCPGFGPHKARRLHKVLNEPFKRSKSNGSFNYIPNDNADETGCKLIKPVSDSTSDQTVCKKMKIDKDNTKIRESPTKRLVSTTENEKNKEDESTAYLPKMSKSEAIYQVATSRRKQVENDQLAISEPVSEDYFGNPFDASDDDFKFVSEEAEGTPTARSKQNTEVSSSSNINSQNRTSRDRRSTSRNSTEQVQSVPKHEELLTSMQMTEEEYKDLIASSSDEGSSDEA